MLFCRCKVGHRVVLPVQSRTSCCLANTKYDIVLSLMQSTTSFVLPVQSRTSCCLANAKYDIVLSLMQSRTSCCPANDARCYLVVPVQGKTLIMLF